MHENDEEKVFPPLFNLFSKKVLGKKRGVQRHKKKVFFLLGSEVRCCMDIETIKTDWRV